MKLNNQNNKFSSCTNRVEIWFRTGWFSQTVARRTFRRHAQGLEFRSVANDGTGSDDKSTTTRDVGMAKSETSQSNLQFFCFFCFVFCFVFLLFISLNFQRFLFLFIFISNNRFQIITCLFIFSPLDMYEKMNRCRKENSWLKRFKSRNR